MEFKKPSPIQALGISREQERRDASFARQHMTPEAREARRTKMRRAATWGTVTALTVLAATGAYRVATADAPTDQPPTIEQLFQEHRKCVEQFELDYRAETHTETPPPAAQLDQACPPLESQFGENK